jgi:hypothetical protein
MEIWLKTLYKELNSGYNSSYTYTKKYVIYNQTASYLV